MHSKFIKFLYTISLIAVILIPSSIFFYHTSTAKIVVVKTNPFSDSELLKETRQDVEIYYHSKVHTKIYIESNNKYQSMVGFGAAMTDSSAWLLRNYLDSATYNDSMVKLFDVDDGIGINMLRITIGSSDCSPDWYNYAESGSDLSGFSIDYDKQYKIPVLKKALEINPSTQIVASPWSAPGWMKLGNNLTDPNTKGMIGGFLNPIYEEMYADYLLKFVQAYLEENINIYGISIQNEPFHSPDDYPGMLMNTTQQINIIKHLGFRFREYNINTKILLLDHNWDLYEKAIEVLQDQDAYSYIDGIAWHGYSGPNPRIQDTIKKEFPEKDHYFTEITGFKGAPNFHDNLVWWYKNIYIGSIQNWAKTVLLWNIVLDENGGPMLRDYTDMRGVITVKSPNDVQFEGEYYAIGQMSKFVPRNSVRVGTRTNSDDLYTVAFRTPDGSTILVVLNGSDSGIEFEIVHGLNRMQYSISAKSVFTFCYNF